MDKASSSKFQFKKQTFAMSKTLPKQSCMDTFLQKPKASKLTAEKENEKYVASVGKTPTKRIIASLDLMQTQDDDVLIKPSILPSYEEEDIDKLFDDADVKPRNDCFVEKHTASQDSSWPYDSPVALPDAERSPVLTNKRKPKKFGKIYQDMDYEFDYTDWSEKKKAQSTPFRTSVSPKLESLLDFANEKDTTISTSKNMSISKEKQSTANCALKSDFADEFSLDLNDDHVQLPKQNQNCRTPVKRSESPDLFEPSPECKVTRSEIFSKNFCLLRPPKSPTAGSKPKSTSSADGFVVPKDVPIAPILSSPSSSPTNSPTNLNVHDHENSPPSVKQFLEEAQTDCFGNLSKNNSLLQVESNLDVLRGYEKKILETTFEWFTSMPTFVAEQIHYVLDANNLTRLKMFRARIREKIAEAETISLERLAEDSPKDHENFCRIEQKITFLSEAMKSLKNVVASSPNKNVDNDGKSVVRKCDKNLNNDLFSSDDGSNEDDHHPRNRKKLNEKIISKKVSSDDGKYRSELGLNLAPVAALKRSTFDSADFERLPSTQDIERVFDSWKDSTDQTLRVRCSEKRKRGESSVRRNASPPSSPVFSKSRTVQIVDHQTRDVSKSLFDTFDGGNNDDYDDDFPILSDSELLSLAVKKRRSTSDGAGTGTVETDCNRSIIQPTGYVAKNRWSFAVPSDVSNGQQFGESLNRRTDDFISSSVNAPNDTNDANLTHCVPGAAMIAAAFDKPCTNYKNSDISHVPNTSDASIVHATGQFTNSKFKFKAPRFGSVGISNNSGHTFRAVSNSCLSENCMPVGLDVGKHRHNGNAVASALVAVTNERSINETPSDDRLFDDIFQSQLSPRDCTGRLNLAADQAAGHNSNVDRNNSSVEGQRFRSQISDNLFESDDEIELGTIESVAKSSLQPSNNVNICHVPSPRKTFHAKPSVDTSIAGKFANNFPNDGITGEFSRDDYPHSAELNRIFRTTFGLHKFRPIQLEAINAALLRYDCFVLMPTGGGKSLCYQLPALLTNGVTIVISPLKSLIIDQTEKLKSLDIVAAHLLGETTTVEANNIYADLCRKEPNLKMLYVTPEKIASSLQLQNIFSNLYNRNLLSRFVIDEAHCVSQWGHDFRTDYKKLCSLRQNYPRVPIMALTATATARVRNDILHQLNIKSPKWFISSFNRPNLKYQVVPKKGNKSALAEIIDLIKTKFPKQSGILYCLSRKECDNCAETLRKSGVKAVSYHAGLKDMERNDVQSKWVGNKFQIVCATIAFGMGIDKPDVRFVIHFSLPKSIEGYYQESGRAGRDGKKSWCILYYSYQDVHRIKKLIQLGDGNAETKEVHYSNLSRIVRFCENKTDCRRSLQLNYFGELFKRELCVSNTDTICDNCSQINSYKVRDVTEDCKAIVRTVSDICGGMDGSSWNKNFTSTYIADIFKGAKLQKITGAGHNTIPLYGRGKNWNRTDIDRLVHQLALDGYLQEKLMLNREEIVLSYIKLGPKADDLLNGKVKITFPMMESAAFKANVSEPRIEKKINSRIEELHGKCYEELMEALSELAESSNSKASSIMNVEAIQVMSLQLPTTEEEMLLIDGVTKANFDKFGKFMLKITSAYASKKQEIAPTVEMVEEKNYDHGDDETEALTWNDVDPCPYFASSSSSSSQSRKKPKATTYGRKIYKRKSRRRKKASPNKRSKKFAATPAKSKKSPAKPQPLAQNRALAAKRLGFLSLPKQYAHCSATSSSSLSSSKK